MGGSEPRTLRIRRWANRELNQFAYNWQIERSIGRASVFQVELTNRCPMTCAMCPRTHSMTRSLGDMSEVVYARVLDEAAATTKEVFLHHFGDSLLHPELGPFIRMARERRIATFLSANPILLTKPRIEAIVDSGLEEIVLSLDGVTPETSAVVRGPAAANVERAEARVHALLAHRAAVGSSTPRIVLQIVRQRQNMHEVDAWLEKWSGVDGIATKVKSFIGWSGSEQEIEALRPADRATSADVVCDKPWTSVTVLWDGTVVPCCFDHDGTLALGNLATQSLDEIWRDEKLRSLRRAHKSGELAGVDLCAGCKDKEGYPVRKLHYPLNRLRQQREPLGDEWSQGAELRG